MSPILEAFGLFLKHRHLRRYAVKPLVTTATIFLGLLLVAWLVAVAPIQRALADLLPGKESDLALGLVGQFTYVLVFTVWLLLAAMLFVAVATMVGAFLWEKLSHEVETLLYGNAPTYAHSPGAIAVDSVSRLAFVAGAGLASLCASAIPFLPVFLAGYPATLDYTATAYSRRGMMLRGQLRRVYRVPGIWPFHIVAALVSLIPVVNLLMLPIMVTAGTILVVRHERGKSAP